MVITIAVDAHTRARRSITSAAARGPRPAPASRQPLDDQRIRTTCSSPGLPVGTQEGISNPLGTTDVQPMRPDPVGSVSRFRGVGTRGAPDAQLASWRRWIPGSGWASAIRNETLRPEPSPKTDSYPRTSRIDPHGGAPHQGDPFRVATPLPAPCVAVVDGGAGRRRAS